jgi:MFS family permease
LTDLRQFRLLTTHYGLYQFSTAMAGAFAGAYLLRMGFSLAQTLAAFAGLLAVRFMARSLSVPLVRLVGIKGATILGALIVAAQFFPLARASEPLWLLIWLATFALGESLYWPSYHAMAAMTGSGASRGRELGWRHAVAAFVYVVGPLIGGVLLERFGAQVNFALAAVTTLLSAAPLFFMHKIDAGEISTPRLSFREIDRRGVLAFAADGFMCAGLAFAWPMALFIILGSGYESFGIANAAAGLAGALASLIVGHVIDRGNRERALIVVSLCLAASFAFRAGASWSPLAAFLAHASGAAVMAVYTTVLMTMIYDRAKNSGAAFRFHFAAEGGWDAGAALGCLAGAGVALLTEHVSLVTLPAAAGIVLMYLCVRASARTDHTP